MNNQGKNNNTLVIYYLTLRALVGCLGIFLPIILFFGAWIIFGTKLQSSISAYYHTQVGDVLVGSLFAFGVFLFSYKGWDKDYIFARCGGVFAIGIALFPTNAKDAPFTWVTVLHFIFTFAFFLTLIYFCLKLFVKSDQPKPYNPKKQLRNRVYRVCGWVMIICLAGIGVNFVVPGTKSWLGGSLVFYMETFAIWAFGISWFTKGETLKYLRD
jgi:formate hydrogenlyase subunit 3/multisubunit Na+/H+ antiporter MnhD subunit